MGKNKRYLDDYTGDVKSIRKSHKKFRLLIGALCVTGVVAAGSATYVLMNPAQTMTKEGIDEMDPNEDFIVAETDLLLEDAVYEEDLREEEENLDAVPLIEEADEDEKAPADAMPVEDQTDASQEAALSGGVAPEAGALVADLEETESEIPETELAEADETALPESEAAAETAAPEEEAAEIIGTSETEVGETITEVIPESESAVVEEVQTEAPAEEAAQTELTVEETEAAAAEPEAVVEETEEIVDEETEEIVGEAELPETEEIVGEAGTPETEEIAGEAESEEAESETQASEIREKSKDEVYVETEGELLDEKWIDSVGLEVRTEKGWSTAETDGEEAIEVDADQTLRFRVTYTVQPGTLSSEMRTLIYQIPKEIKKVDESYGEIVDAQDQILANYAIDESGLIRVTFTEDIAALNEAGTKVTCKIEFRTEASNLAQ